MWRILRSYDYQPLAILVSLNILVYTAYHIIGGSMSTYQGFKAMAALGVLYGVSKRLPKVTSYFSMILFVSVLFVVVPQVTDTKSFILALWSGVFYLWIVYRISLEQWTQQ